MVAAPSRPVRLLIEFVACLGLSALLSAQSTLHVDATAPPAGSGASWNSAINDLSLALAQANPGDSVWVREGAYFTSVPLQPTDPRTATFFVPQGVELYGGFDGTETLFSQRAGRFEQTVLSGDLGVLGDPSDNARSVVTVHFPSGVPLYKTYVDGFQIRDGNGSDQDPFLAKNGGGIRSFNSVLIVRNCIVRDNIAEDGGGMHAQPGAANVSWCTFENNLATKDGGAIAGQIVNLNISHCVFRANVALGRGGAVFQKSTAGGLNSNAVRFGNCVLANNRAMQGGAAFLGANDLTSSGKISFRSCTIAFNEATVQAGGIQAVTGTAVPAISRLYNCIVWGNSAPSSPNLLGRHWIFYSCIEGSAWGGLGNVYEAPRFRDGLNGDLHLLPGSPASDAGSNAYLPNDWCDVDMDGDSVETVPLDLEGNTRIVDAPGVGPAGQAIVDMGAFETP